MWRVFTVGRVRTLVTEETDAKRPSHLDDVADGCGCVELWEVLSERRAEGENGQRADADDQSNGAAVDSRPDSDSE